MKDRTWVIVALLTIAAVMAVFFSISPHKTIENTQVVVVKDPCRICGQSLYREELDYFVTMWIGDLPVLIPIYKTVLHDCHERRQ